MAFNIEDFISNNSISTLSLYSEQLGDAFNDFNILPPKTEEFSTYDEQQTTKSININGGIIEPMVVPGSSLNAPRLNKDEFPMDVDYLLLEPPSNFLSNDMVIPSLTNDDLQFLWRDNCESLTNHDKRESFDEDDFFKNVDFPSFMTGSVAKSDDYPPLIEDSISHLNLFSLQNHVESIQNISIERGETSICVEEEEEDYDWEEDEYNWRKYGKKTVKGYQYPRSYYKCTYPNCEAKKKVRESEQGQTLEIIYSLHHNHPKPPPDHHRITSSSVLQEQKHNDDGSEKLGYVGEKNESRLKRRKNEEQDFRDVRQPIVTFRVISEIYILNDGYNWRKYGQKTVKANRNPRSYYKCNQTNCPVKKQVERAPDDIKAVLTTYQGRHNHVIPPAKNKNLNNSGSSQSMMPAPILPLIQNETMPSLIPSHTFAYEMNQPGLVDPSHSFAYEMKQHELVNPSHSIAYEMNQDGLVNPSHSFAYEMNQDGLANPSHSLAYEMNQQGLATSPLKPFEVNQWKFPDMPLPYLGNPQIHNDISGMMLMPKVEPEMEPMSASNVLLPNGYPDYHHINNMPFNTQM